MGFLSDKPEDTLQVKNNSGTANLLFFVIIGVLSGLSILVILLLTLNYFSLVSFSSVVPSFSFIPISKNSTSLLTATPYVTQFPSADHIYVSNPVPYNICFESHTGYPSNKTIRSSIKDKLGTYRGKIISVDAQKQTITVQSSVDASLFPFFLHYILDKIFTVSTSIPIQLTKLRQGDIVTVFFPCYQDPGRFVLTEVQVKQ